jgi:hypothetical protein
MELIADMLLVAGSFGAAAYCLVLSRRLSRFTRLESGMGGAIAVLSAQVDDLTRALARAQETAGDSTVRLATLTRRAEAAAARLEVLLASMHDLPGEGDPAAQAAPPSPADHAEGERRSRQVRRFASHGRTEAE